MIQQYIINVKFMSLGSEERLRSLPVGVRNGKEQQKKKTCPLCYLEDSTLASKKDGSSEHTLNDFTADALVKALDAFFLHDG